MNDLWNIIPTNPPVETVELSGEELWNMMEENLERTFSSDPYQQMSGYVERCRGVNIYIKIENPAGTCIQEFFVQGECLDKNKTYQAAFVTQQGCRRNTAKTGKRSASRRSTRCEIISRSKKPVHAELRSTVVAV